MTISEWLKTIGMERYAPVFEANHLSFENLDAVTEADLESIGIPLGHRKNILKEIHLLQSRDALERSKNQVKAAKKRVGRFVITLLVLAMLAGGAIGYAMRAGDGALGVEITRGLLGGALGWLCGCLYMLPTLLAFERENKFRWAIAISNVFSGVTGIGWVILLLLGLKKIDGGQALALAAFTDSTSWRMHAGESGILSGKPRFPNTGTP
jgi:hypothetical protein